MPFAELEDTGQRRESADGLILDSLGDVWHNQWVQPVCACGARVRTLKVCHRHPWGFEPWVGRSNR